MNPMSSKEILIVVVLSISLCIGAIASICVYCSAAKKRIEKKQKPGESKGIRI